VKRIAAEVVLIVSVSTVAAATALVLWLRRLDKWFSAAARPNRIL